MAKIAKSQDTRNWRKGVDLTVGDQVAVRWNDAKAIEFSSVISVEQVDAATLGQRGGRQYRAHLANGATKSATGAEYVEGRYEV
jgi:hypothetical protein